MGATPQRCYRGDPTAHSPAMEATPQPTASLWGRPHSPQRRYGGDPTAHSITMGATPQPTASLRGRPHSPQRRVGRPQPPPPPPKPPGRPRGVRAAAVGGAAPTVRLPSQCRAAAHRAPRWGTEGSGGAEGVGLRPLRPPHPFKGGRTGNPPGSGREVAEQRRKRQRGAVREPRLGSLRDRNQSDQRERKASNVQKGGGGGGALRGAGGGGGG